MERFLFNEAEFETMYSCKHYDERGWYARGRPSLYVGVAYIMAGIVYDLLYFPFLILMCQREFLRFSAYKIMLYLGFIDVICIVCNSLICGYLSIIGAVFCTHPKFIYVLGCISTALWAAACATCMLLGLNRCCEILFPKLCSKFFKGNRTYFWLILPTIYFLYFCFFTNPLLFSSNYYAMFFDPYVGIFRMKNGNLTDDQTHEHWPHTINNIIVVVVLLMSYLFLCLIVALKSHFNQQTNLNIIQRQTFIQVTLICFLNATAASVYVYMQFFYTPTWLVIVGQVTWQASHGAAVFVYLFLNPSMRHALFTKIFKFGPNIAVIRPLHNQTFTNIEKTKL